MSKFLTLCEEINPENTGNPKWELIDFLKSKGINAYPVKNTDTIYIDTGNRTIPINIFNNEEESENIQAGFGDYSVDNEIEKLGNQASSGLQGMAAQLWGTDAQKAKQALQQRKQVVGKAIPAYNMATKRIENGLKSINNSANSPTISF